MMFLKRDKTEANSSATNKKHKKCCHEWVMTSENSQREVLELKDKNEEYKQEISNLNDRVNHVLSEYSHLQQKMDSYEYASELNFEELECENNKLEKNNEELNSKIKYLQQKNHLLSNQVIHLDKELTKHKEQESEIEDLANENEELTQENYSLEEEITYLEGQLKTEKKEANISEIFPSAYIYSRLDFNQWCINQANIIKSHFEDEIKSCDIEMLSYRYNNAEYLTLEFFHSDLSYGVVFCACGSNTEEKALGEYYDHHEINVVDVTEALHGVRTILSNLNIKSPIVINRAYKQFNGFVAGNTLGKIRGVSSDA